MSVLPSSYTLIAKAAGVVAIVGGIWFANQHYIVKPAVDRANRVWQQRWDVKALADKTEEFTREQQAREQERSLQAAADAEQQKSNAERSVLLKRVADSRAASERLQQGVSNAINQLGGSVASTTAGGPAKPGTGVLLTELYRSINQRAADLAGEADSARRAGLTCERVYDNARKEKAR